MEKAGFVEVLDRVRSKGINVKRVSTDRHPQIRKLLRSNPKYKGKITHNVDPWHLIKGLKKKLNAKAKKANCAIIGKRRFCAGKGL